MLALLTWIVHSCIHRIAGRHPMAAIIPLTDIRAAASAAARDAFVRAAANAPPPRAAPVVDVRRRPLHDLRISVTDRCNFRCVYCMPKDVFGRDYPFLPHAELLTFEEIARVAQSIRRAWACGRSG